ncbi:CDGSH iron-sulfur domain-containing protein [Oerskovia sp. NPDC056781]|uniref:CDGSH iron-sulfur domain-containing protein n=1 Tax=Oerskovia sp. NPDC056781 TaxID=3345942 RepID=UPI00367087A8
MPRRPLLIRGRHTIVDAYGSPIEPRGGTVALCCCGASVIKPFCDRTRTFNGFRSDDEDRGRRELERPTGAARRPRSAPVATPPASTGSVVQVVSHAHQGEREVRGSRGSRLVVPGSQEAGTGTTCHRSALSRRRSSRPGRR